MLMKQKLLNRVRPIPQTALQAERLSSFREHPYTVQAEPALLPPTDDTESILSLSSACCNWCGTWMPMPRQIIIAMNNSHTDTDAAVATVAKQLDGTIVADTKTSAEIATGKEDDSETLGLGSAFTATGTFSAKN